MEPLIETTVANHCRHHIMCPHIIDGMELVALQATYFKQLRIWCKMELCSWVWGNTVEMASAKPFRFYTGDQDILYPSVLQVSEYA